MTFSHPPCAVNRLQEGCREPTARRGYSRSLEAFCCQRLRPGDHEHVSYPLSADGTCSSAFVGGITTRGPVPDTSGSAVHQGSRSSAVNAPPQQSGKDRPAGKPAQLRVRLCVRSVLATRCLTTLPSGVTYRLTSPSRSSNRNGFSSRAFGPQPRALASIELRRGHHDGRDAREHRIGELLCAQVASAHVPRQHEVEQDEREGVRIVGELSLSHPRRCTRRPPDTRAAPAAAPGPAARRRDLRPPGSLRAADTDAAGRRIRRDRSSRLRARANGCRCSCSKPVTTCASRYVP